MEEDNINQEELNDKDLQDNLDEVFDSKNDQEQHEPIDEITALKNKVIELEDKNLRLFAEFENFRKRTQKERYDLLKTASQDTLSALLPVLDDFDRAKKIADALPEIDAFTEGVLLVYNKLYSIVKSKGLVELESNGKPFDADLYEAITNIPAPTEALKGAVVDTIEKGYLLNDKLIRHAKVVVGI